MTLVVIKERLDDDAEDGYYASYHSSDGMPAYRHDDLHDVTAVASLESQLRDAGARNVTDDECDGDVVSAWQY